MTVFLKNRAAARKRTSKCSRTVLTVLLEYRYTIKLSSKHSVVNALFSRAYTIVSEDEDRKAESQLVTDTLLHNDYPADFINREHDRIKHKMEDKKAHHLTETELSSATVVIPFFDQTTQAIQRILRPLGIRVVGRPCQWTWSLQRQLKDPVDPKDETGAVYAINCKDCPGVYIGETGRTVRVRMAEHSAHARHGRADLSAAAEHAILKDHRLDWENPEVIDRDRKTLNRRVKEALLIRKRGAQLNKDNG